MMSGLMGTQNNKYLFHFTSARQLINESAN